MIGEKVKLEKKISSGLISSIWIQFGTDLEVLESEIMFIKATINNFSKNYEQKIKYIWKLINPSKQFISRFKFRPWKGVYISDKYLNSFDKFYDFIREIIRIYLENNICPVIETEFFSKDKIENIYSLLNTK